MLTVGSLFSGIGGLDRGFELAGMGIVAQCEADAYCRGILARHWPDIPCFKDIREVSSRSWATIRPGQVDRDAGKPDAERPRVPLGRADASVDLLCGGFPCQDLSVAGKRAGLAGARSGLFFEFARVADELVRPGGWLVLENVPGLLSSAGGRDFAVVVRTLGDIGFHDLAWRVLDSRYFGVPQRRRRVFIVARRAVGRSAREVLLEPESGGGDFAPRREAGLRVAASLSRGSSGPGVSAPGRRQEDDRNIVSTLQARRGRTGDTSAEVAAGGHLQVAPAIVKRYGKGTDSDATDALITHTLRAEGFDAGEDGTDRGTPLIAGTVRSHMRPGSNDVGGIAYALRRDPGGTGQGHNTNYVVGAAPDGDRVPAPSGLPRRLAMAAHRRPDGPGYAACGNAVSVPVAQWVGERLMAYELASTSERTA